MISMYKFQKIRELHQLGLSNFAIAKRLGIDRKTVAKYLALNSPPRYPARKTRTRVDPFAPFEDLVLSWLKTVEDLTGSDIYELLVEQGYRGSERTVFRRLERIAAQKPKERFFEQSYEPGEQCQLDFKEKVSLPFAEGETIVHLHFGTLPYSGKFFISGWRFKNWEAFGEGMHRFFENIGGVPLNVRIDNLSPCVRHVLKGSERIYTESFKEAMAHYGIGCLPCRPRAGSDKGDVEREIRTHSGRIQRLIRLQGKVFSDIEDLNQWLAAYCEKRSSDNVREKWRTEQGHLRPVAEHNAEVLCRTFKCKPTLWGTVRDEKSKATYSVPDCLIGERCHVTVGAEIVAITSLRYPQLTVHHPRQACHGKNILIEHVLPSLVRKPAAMVRWAHREILFPRPEFKKFLTWLGGEHDASARSEFLRSVNLVQYTSIDEIALAMRLIRESNSSRPFDDIKDLLLIGRRPSPMLNQKRLEPDLKIYDSLIPIMEETKHGTSTAC